MSEVDNDVLDPAHVDDGGVTHAGAAGMGDGGAEPKWEPSEDGNIVKHGEKTYITKAALDQARAESRQLRETLDKLEPVLPEFEQFLKNRHAGRDATVMRGADGGDGEYSEDELDGYAISVGLYQADGVTPDRKRAQTAMDVMSKVAERRAGLRIKAVEDRLGRDQASRNTEFARTRTFVDGEPIADQKYLDATIAALPDGMMADPTVANLTNVIAAGLEYLDLRKQGKTRRGGGRGEPMHIEGGGGRFESNGGQMTELDMAAARARGKTPEQWMKMQGSNKAAQSRSSSTGDILEDV